jgi:hypothetical protein
MNREASNRTPSQIPISDDNDNRDSSNNSHDYVSSSWNQFARDSKLEIIKTLGLVTNIESNRIVAKLLIDGRQALSKENNILSNVYHQQMTSDQSELLEILKKYFDRQWHTTTPDWFKPFVQEQKKISPTIYNQLLTYTADNGSKFLQDNFYLSLTIRLLFDFQNQTEPSFTQIWNAATNQGLQGIKKYQSYLASKLNEKLFESNDRNPLYLVLDNYFRQSLTNLFKQQDLNIQPDLFEHALNCVINNGWWNGLNDQKISNELSSDEFKRLIESLSTISNFPPVTQSIVTTTEQLPDLPSSSTEPSLQINESEMNVNITTIVPDPTPPIALSSPIEVPNTSVHISTGKL